jgi:transcriptional regulator with XRE-family HTH domain
MSESWAEVLRRYRVRHALTQARMADVLGVSQRTISRWERGEDNPSLDRQRQLRDLCREPNSRLLRSLVASVTHSPFPRALSRMPTLQLLAVSPAAVAKRPSITNWIGRDLAKIACGVLEEMLDDTTLQRNIANGEIACVLTTTRSVLRTAEHASIRTYRTIVTYYAHEGTIYSDAMAVPAPRSAKLGYKAISMDEVCTDPV